jgi:hypothetical protein
MKARAFVGFAVVTVVVTAAALVTVANRYWISSTIATVKPFPNLLANINDVAELDIHAASGDAVIKRTDTGWAMAGKHDYPVKAEMVKSAVIGFGEMELTERKTSRPDRYPRLAVEDVGGTDTHSRLVTLKDAKGDKLAELIVGRPRGERVGGQAGLYVRRPGDAQAWFTPANFEIPTNPNVWLEPRVIHVNSKRVARITTIQPNGATLVLYKDTPQTKHFAFKDLPPDKPVKGEAVADDMDSALSAIELTDVALQSDVDFSQKPWHAKIETFDGLVVDVDLVVRDQEIWAKFAATTEAPLADRDAQPPEVQAFLSTPDDVAKEAEALNSRFAKWAYELQKYQGLKLQADLGIFLENETPEGGAGPMGGLGPIGPGGAGAPPPPGSMAAPPGGDAGPPPPGAGQ